MRGLLVRLQANWMRNTLAMLQVAMSIAAVVAVVATVIPAFRPVTVADDGAAVMEVRFGVRTTSSEMGRSAFTMEDIDALLENPYAIEAASIEDWHYMPLIKVGDQRYLLQSAASVMPGYARIVGLEMVAGSFFTEADASSSGTSGVVISDQLATMVFGRVDVVGEHMNWRPDGEGSALRGFATVGRTQDTVSWASMPGRDMQVVGVFNTDVGSARRRGFSVIHMYTPPGIADDVYQVGSTVVSSSGGTMAVSSSSETSAQIAMPVMFERKYSELLIKPLPGMEEEAMAEIRTVLEPRLRARGEYDALMDGHAADILFADTESMDAQYRLASLQGAALIGAMGLAALVVSGFAIFTTTMAGLTQRTRYIGLARAIGATRLRVLREVVAESAFLAGIGGVIGALAAYPLGRYVLGQLLGTPAETGDLVVAGGIGVGLAVVIGAVAALYPGWAVARLVPAEAWREGHV